MSGSIRSVGSWLGRSIWRALPARSTLGPVSAHDHEGANGHPVEWWYLVGQLDAADRGPAQRLGFELTVARLADPLTARLAGWAAVFSFIDPDRGLYRVHERRVWPPRSPARPRDRGVHLQIGDGELRLRAEDWVLDGADGRFHLRARLPSGEGVDLDLDTTRPAVRFGDDGVVDYGGREQMAWVSWTRLRASGTAYDGHMARPVGGLVWMDHQWGAPHLAGYRWTVTSVHLDGGDDVLAWRMTDRAGRPVDARCARVSPDGSLREVGAEDVQLTDLPPPFRAGRAEYRPTTRVVCDALGLDLTARPLLLDQRKRTAERFQAFPVWWEGACDVEGLVDGARAHGRAFVEIAGVE